MQCQRCKSANPEGAAFCQSCGTQLEIVCAACGRGSAPTARFCGWCGGSLTQDMLVVEPGGERKQATVLFADIVGSTQMIAGMDAEGAMDRLQPVVAAMARAVRRYDGTILRTLGDGLKAAFGAPIAREGHALLATQAALAMREAVASLPYAPPIRIGLHSGEVVAGALDTGSTVELEAQGMTVHLANRIEQFAAPGEILLSGDCRALIGAYCETESLGSRAVRGIHAPIDLYRLVGLRPAVASDHFRGNELARFRGRDTELTLLKEALLAAENGTASVIGISAPAGLGKSRLCFEFGEWCRLRRVDVVEGRAHLFGKATPLLPVLEMLRTFLRVTPQMDPMQARDRVTRRMAMLGLENGADLASLLDFLGIPAPDLPMPRLDPRVRLGRLRDIVQAMVKAAGQRPSVLIVEDMHWLDEASATFMQTLVEAVVGTRTVVVFNYRPSWVASFGDSAIFREIRLDELSRPDASQLVYDMIGTRLELRQIADHVSAQSGGNPFFAEQLVLSLVQGGVLAGERGDYRLAADVPRDVALPATVEAVIDARLDTLPDREKAILRIAAIIGKEFPQSLVERVAEIGPDVARTLLGRLCDAEVIQPCIVVGGAGYTFRHPLIQEVAYAMQLRARRTRLHAAVAKSMATFEWGLADEFAGLLAHHCEAAGQMVAAARHLERAARWLGRTNAAQALADWKRMRWVLRDQPSTDENDRLRATASGQIVIFGWREGLSAEEAGPYAEEALRYVRKAGDGVMHEPLLLASYGRILAASGAADDYVRLAHEALALAGPNGEPARLGTINVMLSQAYWLSGRLQEAIDANDKALAAFASQYQDDGRVVTGVTVNQIVGFDIEHWVRCLRTRILVWLGRFDEAETWIARVSQVDPSIVDHVVQFIPHCAAVELAWHRGYAASADYHAGIVAEFAQKSAMPYLHVMAQTCRGLAASVAGEYDVADEFFRNALLHARQSKAALEFEARLLAHQADNYRRAGQGKRAIEVTTEAIGVARRRTDCLGECHARAVAVSVLALRDGEAFDRARELMAISGAVILAPLIGEPYR